MTKDIAGISKNRYLNAVFLISLMIALSSCSHARVAEHVDDILSINEIGNDPKKYDGKRLRFKAFLWPGYSTNNGPYEVFIAGYSSSEDNDNRCNATGKKRILGRVLSKSMHDKIRKSLVQQSEAAYVEIYAYGTVKNEPDTIYAVSEINFDVQINDIELISITQNFCDV